MSIDNLKASIPDYAKDIRLNLSSIARDETMGAAQLWGCLLASAIATRNAVLAREMGTEAATHMTAEEMNAAKTAAALMSMNNIYYRATHLMSARDYAALPARLRMNAMANPGVPKQDFELWSLAVSAVNGCGMCLDAHEAELRKHGVSNAVIQTALRAAAIVHATATVLDGETALAA